MTDGFRFRGERRIALACALYAILGFMGCEASRSPESGAGSQQDSSSKPPDLMNSALDSGATPPDPMSSETDSASAPLELIDVATLPMEPGTHRYFNGVLCCAEGEGDACCDEYDGPGDFDGSLICAPHGGSLGRCLEAGEEADWKTPCVHCCEGLDHVQVVSRKDGECLPAPPSVHVCSRCGDGFCTTYEECTCPDDC